MAVPRKAEMTRTTKETDIRLTLALDGNGQGMLGTGIGFFDHMLDGFRRHGFFDLDLTCSGDLQVDGHHTVEDCGIALGTAIAQATGDKSGLTRFGSCILPMDEVLVLCALDLSGRPAFSFDAGFLVPSVGGLDTELVREFFCAVAMNAGMSLHLKVLTPGNAHHTIEALFKAFGRALDQATTPDARLSGALSTKGSL